MSLTITITISDEGLAALLDRFGLEVGVQILVQAWVDDWLVQFTREYEDKKRRAVYKGCPENVKEAILTALKTGGAGGETVK